MFKGPPQFMTKSTGKTEDVKYLRLFIVLYTWYKMCMFFSHYGSSTKAFLVQQSKVDCEISFCHATGRQTRYSAVITALQRCAYYIKSKSYMYTGKLKY